MYKLNMEIERQRKSKTDAIQRREVTKKVTGDLINTGCVCTNAYN